jgi:hypothetical protein
MKALRTNQCGIGKLLFFILPIYHGEFVIIFSPNIVSYSSDYLWRKNDYSAQKKALRCPAILYLIIFSDFAT